VNLTDPAELRALLRRHGLRPRKRWGQHFLVSPSVVRAILDRASSFPGVIEAGPGPGVLTRALCQTAQVIAYEVDPVAVSALRETAPAAEVRHADVLRADLVAAFGELPEPRALVSNMPYQITGPLLTAFAGARHAYARAVLMMQREVGERVLAKPGTGAFGSLSVFLQAQFSIRRVCDAPPGAFYPPPKVASVVLEFEPLPEAPFEARLFRVVRLGFAQPRKTLANNLAAGLGRERPEVLELLASLGWDQGVRPHQIPLEGWRTIAGLLEPEAHTDR
jgi:16S rRNA (adenine1518-N6/adenine1519-N6)-dimethyltransferase